MSITGELSVILCHTVDYVNSQCCSACQIANSVSWRLLCLMINYS